MLIVTVWLERWWATIDFWGSSAVAEASTAKEEEESVVVLLGGCVCRRQIHRCFPQGIMLFHGFV